MEKYLDLLLLCFKGDEGIAKTRKENRHICQLRKDWLILHQVYTKKLVIYSGEIGIYRTLPLLR